MKTLLTSCTVYDGTGNAPFSGEILLENDRIAAVAPKLSDADTAGASVTDLGGLSVAPGFFDAHSHNDWFAVKKDPLPYFEPFVRQGITSFITGNCGLSATAFEPDTPYLEKIGAGLFGYRGDTTGVYPSAGSLLAAVDGTVPCNIAVLAGHCSARAGVSGYENRQLTPEETSRMLASLEKSLQEGACGISLGLMYNPGIFADTEELKKVARLAELYDRPLTVHPRAESKVSMAYPQLLGRSHLLRALDELHGIARGTHLKLEYSHAIFVGRSTFRDKDEFMAVMKQMRDEGIDARFDIYDELLGVSVITVVMPVWYQALSPAEKRRPLNMLRFALLATASEALLGFTWKDITIAYVGKGNEKYEGKTVAECAKMMGKSCIGAYLALCEMSNFTGRVNMGPYSTPQIISEQSKDPYCMFMTDAWVEEHGVQNPAVYDVYPKILKHALDGSGDTLPATVRKMSGAVADRFSIPERGYLRPGYYADLTVFDESALAAGTPDCGRPFGIRRVFINGKCVLNGDSLNTAALRSSGRAMRAK